MVTGEDRIKFISDYTPAEMRALLQFISGYKSGVFDVAHTMLRTGQLIVSTDPEGQK